MILIIRRSEKVKIKIFSVMMALVLALSLTLVVAVPAGADLGTRQAALILAADHIVANQNNDGGFDWTSDVDPTNASPTNITGVTAMGILKAYPYNTITAYRTALAEAYYFCVTYPPTYTWSVSKYSETTAGVDSAPDITFLVRLADAAAVDPLLLGEIVNQVLGTTVADIYDLAQTRWDNVVLYMGSNNIVPNGNATMWAQRVRDDRDAQNYDALIPWGLEFGVKATLALETAFPGQGYAQQAVDIANVIFTSVDDGGNLYFDSTDTTQEEFILGLTGAIEAYLETGTHLAEMAIHVTQLLSYQQPDGSWNFYGAVPATLSVQTTAYAAMALYRDDAEADAIAGANKAAEWLVSSQRLDGGWDGDSSGPTEYPESDGEAATALAISLGGNTVSLRAAVPEILAISVNPTVINYGTIYPGNSSAIKVITVKNIGTEEVDVSANLYYVYLGTVFEYLELDGWGVLSWTAVNLSAADLASGDSEPINSQLVVPEYYNPAGSETNTLVFTATAS
jgi:hypothetical protein